MCASCGNYNHVHPNVLEVLTNNQPPIMVQKSSLSESDLLKMFLLTWCVGHPEFKAAFAKYGITVEEQDLPVLAKVAANGADLQGAIFNTSGQPVKFSVLEAFGTINIPNDRMQAAMQGACKYRIV